MRINKSDLLKLRNEPIWFFVVTATLFGLLFTFINPPFFGLDERAHFMRSYVISQGSLSTTQVVNNGHSQTGAYLPTNLAEIVQISTGDLLDNDMSKYIFKRHDTDPGLYRRFWTEKLSNKKINDALSNAQLLGTFAYSSLGYLHMAIPIAIAEAFKLPVLPLMYVARIANLMLYICLICIALKIIPKYRWLLVAIALLPAAIFQASVVTLDSIVLGVSMILIALAFKLWTTEAKICKRDALIILVCTLVLALSKVPYLGLLFLFLFLPKSRFTSLKQSVRWKVTLVGAAVLCFGVAVVLAGSASRDIVNLPQNGGANAREQLLFTLHRPWWPVVAVLRTYYDSADLMAATLFGRLGDRSIGITNFYMYLLVMISIGSAILHEQSSRVKSKIKNQQLYLLSMLMAIVGCVILISASLYLTFTEVGSSRIAGIQGRYFLPLLPLLCLMIAEVIPLQARVSKRTLILTSQISIAIFLSASLILYFIASY